MKQSSAAGLELAVLVLFTIGLDVPLLDSRVVPMHDTFYNFANFYLFYGHFFFEGELLQWLPYGAYGLPAALQQVISLSPLDYVVGFVGACARVRDAMLLFKIATIGEHLLFVSGTWLLARSLFTERATALALGIAAAGTVAWYAQLWFELRFFYLLPFLLFCAVRFQQARQPEWLWLGAVTSVAWSLGNVPYFISMWVFTLLWVVVPLAFRSPIGRPRLSAPTLRNLLLAGCFAIGASAFLYVAFHGLDFVVIREPGRDPITRKVDLETFRTWGGNADLAVVAKSFLFGAPVHLPWGMGRDNSAYLGLLPLVGLAVALVRVRDALLFGLIGGAGALVWMSLGGAFTTLVYYLPLLSEFRHVGLVYGLVKVLLLIASGFGLDRLWGRAAAGCRIPRGLATGLALASFAALPFAWGHEFSLRLGCYAAFGFGSLAALRSPRTGLLLALALDLAIYQADVRALVPRLRPESAQSVAATLVSRLPWQSARSGRPEGDANPDPERVLRALELAMQAHVTTIYWNTWAFAYFDACNSRLYTDTLTYGVDTLMRMEVEADVDIQRFLACGVPKLRLVSKPVVVRSLPQAISALAVAAEEAGDRDVIRLPVRAPLPAGARGGNAAPGEVRVARFGYDELVADADVAPPGAWLLYSDAFHPDWTAAVDGRSVAIAEANLAFKAVWLSEGHHTVRFRFGRRARRWASAVLAGFGLVTGCGLPIAVARFAATVSPPARPS